MSTLQLYGQFGSNLLGGEAAGDNAFTDFLSDTIRCTLHTVTYVPNIDTDEVFTDATNELGTASGYTAGGVVLSGKTVTYAAAGNVTTADCADISWTASGGTLTFQIAVFHNDTPTTPANPLIGYIDCGAQAITTGNTFTIATGASGLFTATVT